MVLLARAAILVNVRVPYYLVNACQSLNYLVYTSSYDLYGEYRDCIKKRRDKMMHHLILLKCVDDVQLRGFCLDSYT